MIRSEMPSENLKSSKQLYVNMDHKTSHKGPFFETEIYASFLG